MEAVRNLYFYSFTIGDNSRVNIKKRRNLQVFFQFLYLHIFIEPELNFRNARIERRVKGANGKQLRQGQILFTTFGRYNIGTALDQQQAQDINQVFYLVLFYKR